MKKLVSLILSLALVFSLAACGGQTAQSPAPTQSPAQSDAAEGPVTIENGGRTLTFGEVPQRVVCLNMQMTEMMLMLDLGDKVIYTCYTNAEPMVQIKDAFNAIPLLSEKYPSTEVLLGAEPDLVLGQRFGFTEDKAGTVETLADHGLPAYVSEGTLASEEKIENIYLDIENLGKIFRVEDRAEALIGEMQDKVAAVAEKTAGVEDKITVFVMDSVKENEMYTCAKSMETEVIKLAGGINVCESDSAEQWFYVSAETLIDKNPDVILFNQYGSTPVEEKIAAITSNPALANVDAVKNRRFMTTVLQDVNESVRVADTVTRFAHSFYPELFEQYPVTITSYNQEGLLYDQTFDACPRRVVCNQPQAIQLLLALGLGDKIVGACRSVGDVNEKYTASFEALNFISDNDSPSKEVVLDQDPDLIIGWGSTFGESTLGPVSDWNDRGIHTYIVDNSASGGDNPQPRTVERLYNDIENFGKIFGIEDRAQAMIDDMKARAAKIAERVDTLPEEEKVTVLTVQMVYENEFFGRTSTDFTHDLIEKAGGICLDEAFGKQSIENLIKLNPDVIVVINRTDSPAQEKIDSLKANPSLASVPAVANDRFVSLDYVDFYGGNYETIDTIEHLAQGFYPDLFQ